MNTFGHSFIEKIDGKRIRKQIDTIRELMLDGEWRTLREIALITDYPEASISADLRHLRKEAFWPPEGKYVVTRNRRHGAGTWEYMVRFDKDREQMVLF